MQITPHQLFHTAKLAVLGCQRSGCGVSETMESARRWSGYVCPDCRFVFRVPRDHDGKGIVCPSCRRMLRIPTSTDTPSPLMVPVRQAGAGETSVAVADEPQVLKKRRRGKKHGSSDKHSWESQSKTSRSGRGEKRQMRLMLIGGATLLALIVGGAAVFMKSKTQAASPGVAIASPVGGSKTAETPAPPSILTRSEASLIAESEALTRKFLEAKTVEEILPLVRNPQASEARIRAFYPGGKITPSGLAAFNTTRALAVRGKIMSVSVRTRELDDKAIAFVDSPQGLKIDWESWAAWSELSWEKFLSSKPTTGHVFRVTLSAVDYYNFDFADESKWRSYRLISPDGEHSVYGYVEKGTVLEQRIRPDADTKQTPLMLSLKFPAGATSASQVEIDRFVADGWVEEPDSP